MPFYERHRHLIMILGGFLLLLGALRLFLLGDYYETAVRMDREFDGEIQKRIEKLCNTSAPALVDYLNRQYENANVELERRLEALEQQRHFEFASEKKPLIPESMHAPTYVRQQLRLARDDMDKKLGTFKRVQLGDEAKTLGMNLPEETDETVKRDLEWMRQIIALRRFVDALLEVPEDPQDKPALLALHTIKPLDTVKTGTPPTFMREYRVEAEITISLNGLMRLLQIFSRPKTFHVVQAVDVRSTPEVRLSDQHQTVPPNRRTGKLWYSHYYRVRLRVATLTIMSEKDQEKERRSQVKPRPRRIHPKVY